MMAAPLTALAQALARYAARWPAEADVVDVFLTLLREGGPDAFQRHHLPGHFTGSAWLVSADGRRTLLTHHRKLRRWLQPGGHADGEVDLPAVALREASEESGLAGLLGEHEIFDIDRHLIPARGVEPAHWHYDVRYVIRATADERYAVSEESLDLAWRAIEEVATAVATEPSLRRMAEKWLAKGE